MRKTSITFAVAFGRHASVYGSVGTYRHLVELLGIAATSSFQIGPEGGGVGAPRLTGEARVSSLELTLNTEEVLRLSAELMVDGPVTEDTF